MDIKEFIVSIMQSGVDLEANAQIIVKSDALEIEADDIEVSIDHFITRNIPTFTIELDRYSVVDTSEYTELKEELETHKERIEELERELELEREESA